MSDKSRRVVKALIVGLITGLLACLITLTNLGLTFEREVGLTWLFKVRGPIKPPPDIVVSAINGQTGDQLDLPSLPRDWSRSIHARMIDDLVDLGASSIGFDMQFNKAKNARDDSIFTDAVNKADRVTLIELVTGKGQPLFDPSGRQTGSVWMEQLIKPLPELVAAAKGLATFPLPKIDASVDEFWVFKESVGNAPTLPAVVLQVYALDVYPSLVSLLEQAGAKGADTLPKTIAETGKAEQFIPLMGRLRSIFAANPRLDDRLNQLMAQTPDKWSAKEREKLHALIGMYAGNPHRILNFYGPPGSITTIPYQNIIKEAEKPDAEKTLDLKGKAVLVGFSDLYDPGQPDRFYTVFTNDQGVDLSGVEIAATAFGNLLTGHSITPINNYADLALLFTFGLVMGTLAYLLPALYGVPLAIALALGYALASQWLFNHSYVWLPMAMPLLVQFPLALFLGLIGQYLLERRRGQRISEALSYYLPENVARDLTENVGDPEAFNKVVYGTCLATDMSGFSTISEQLPPDQLAVFLNEYFDTLAGALKRHHVSVTEFRADAIMCAWTADKPTPEVRRKAVLAALDAAEAIESFRQRHSMLKSSLRVGLESGHFYIGHAGGGGHFVFSIVGDTANTASRIESLNKHVGTSIMATEEAVEGVEGLLLRPMGHFQFVGKTEALPIVQIVSSTAHQTDEQVRLCERFAQALAAFHQGHWETALGEFESLQKEFPDDGPTRFYIARCQSYIGGTQPPEDYRVIRMESK
jgi:adenylate cyclase